MCIVCLLPNQSSIPFHHHLRIIKQILNHTSSTVFLSHSYPHSSHSTLKEPMPQRRQPLSGDLQILAPTHPILHCFTFLDLNLSCRFALKRWTIWCTDTCRSPVCHRDSRFIHVGFQHTAFAFAYESMIADTKVYDEYLPPGSLVTYLQKALQYIELETHIRGVSLLFWTNR